MEVLNRITHRLGTLKWNIIIGTGLASVYSVHMHQKLEGKCELQADMAEELAITPSYCRPMHLLPQAMSGIQIWGRSGMISASPRAALICLAHFDRLSWFSVRVSPLHFRYNSSFYRLYLPTI